MIVGRLPLADDRHRRAVEDRVALRQQQQVGRAADRGEPVRRSDDLARRVGRRELARVRPDDHRQPLPRLVIGRQVQRPRELYPVIALVGDELPVHRRGRDLRMGILERRQRLTRAGGQVAHAVVGRLRLRLVLGEDPLAVVAEDRLDRLVALIVGSEQPLARARLEADAIEEGPVPLGRRPLAGRVNPVARLNDPPEPRADHRLARIAVAILRAAVPQLAKAGRPGVQDRRSRAASAAFELGDERDARVGPGDRSGTASPSWPFPRASR